MLITLSGWSWSLLLIGMEVMLLIFSICRVVSSWCAVPLTLLVTDSILIVMAGAPDIVDVLVGTQLGTSEHCFVCCELHVGQSVPEYNVRCTVILKHRTNWDSVRCAVRSFKWNTILKSADPLVVFNGDIGEVIGRYVPITVLLSRSGISNGLMPAAGKLMMLNRLLIVPGVECAMLIIRGQFVLARAEAQWIYGAALSRIINVQGILGSTPPDHVRGRRH